MFYLVFVSASKKHIDWLRLEIFNRLKIEGHINQSGEKNTFQLKYAKGESLKILSKMYSKNTISLSRKADKIKKALKIEFNHNKYARVL